MMKRLLLILLCGVFCLVAPAPVPAVEPLAGEILSPLRIVEDPEGSANVRSEPSVHGKVLEQLPAGTVVAVETGPAQDWVKLWSNTASDQPRYIHSSRLKKVEKWKQIPGRIVKGEETGLVRADGFEVQVKGVPFLAKDHRLSKDKDGQQLVDGKSPWGVDGGLPRVTLTWTASLNGQPLKLPEAATDNLFQPSPETLVILTPGKALDQAVVVMLNSDGAGAYCVAWAFKAGKYCGREVFVPF